jgi:glycerol uptake facilitator-like aquaporin
MLSKCQTEFLFSFCVLMTTQKDNTNRKINITHGTLSPRIIGLGIFALGMFVDPTEHS